MRVDWTEDPEFERSGFAAPVGRLDASGAAAFYDAVAPKVDSGRPFLVLDLGKVDWLSSAGVGALARLLRHAQALGGGLAIFGCEPRVRTVLRICGLESVFNVCESAVEARQRLRAEPQA